MVARKGLRKELDDIDVRIRKIEKEERSIEKESKKIGRKVDSIAKEEETIEKIVLTIGKINVKKKHFLELIRAAAGAFLGVGIGRGLIGLDGVAKNLAWGNVIGILIFILGISALLIYKDERTASSSISIGRIFQRLAFIYAVSIIIELISLVLFNVAHDSYGTLFKIIIVGSYTAMASAISFSLAK